MAKIRILIWSILLLCLGSCKRVPETDLVPELAINSTQTVTSDTMAIIHVDYDTIYANESLTEVEEVVLPEQKPTLQEIYSSQIGIRELTGKNDGPEVEMYLKTVGVNFFFESKNSDTDLNKAFEQAMERLGRRPDKLPKN